jgi:transcriptional regulator with XRE-family HTH domain
VICKWTDAYRIFMVMYMAHSPAWPVDRFRATLDRILDETGLSQAGLSALVPMDQSQLSRWKSGSSRPKFESLTVLGEALRAKYPSLGIGPNDLLESAGYAPPESVTRVGQVALHTPEAAGPGVRVAQPDDSHVTYEVTVDTEVSMEEAVASLGELSKSESVLVWNLQAMEYPPAAVAGAVLLLRGHAARRQGQQDGGGTRKPA